jgi:hypothetical protein
MFAAAFLLILAGIIGKTALRRSRAAGLGELPEALKKAAAIEDSDVTAVRVVVYRLLAWRLRGALVGAVVFAAPAFAIRGTLTLSFVALLAGATSGLAAAEWWRASRSPNPIRSASLQRRTIRGFVGRAPGLLLGAMLLVAGATTAVWVAKQPPNGEWAVHSGHWTCITNVNVSWSGQIAAWATVIATVFIGVGAALAVTRRAADLSLPAAADLALRAAGIRAALGSAITAAGTLAAYTVWQCRAALMLRQTEQVNCATASESAQVVRILLDITVVGCVVVALIGLVGYVLFPARVVPAADRVPVA